MLDFLHKNITPIRVLYTNKFHSFSLRFPREISPQTKLKILLFLNVSNPTEFISLPIVQVNFDKPLHVYCGFDEFS